jgi:hypothetical protein
MHIGAKWRAKIGKLPFDITVKDILELIGEGICPILGTPYNLVSTKVTDTSASLDKFIPTLGYIKENCAVISHLANNIKSSANAEQIRLVANWVKKQELKRKKNG